MKAYEPKDTGPNVTRRGNKDDLLRVAVTFQRPSQQEGPTKFNGRISLSSVDAFTPDPVQADLAISELSRRGFILTGRGALSASMRCTPGEFEKIFQTKLERMKAPGGTAAQFDSVFFPPDGAPWNPDPALQTLLDDVYIQWPHIYMAKAAASTKPKPPVKSHVKKAAEDNFKDIAVSPPSIPYFHLSAPFDIARQLNASPAHNQGITGKGVRIAMIDSGFAHDHPYFRKNGYTSSVVLAPGAIDRKVDGNGHGTGESANIFAIAPGSTFIGVKLDNENNPNLGASILEGLQEALKHNPHVISVRLGYDLREGKNMPALSVPKSLVALEVEIQAAVKRGIVIIFSAGNGHYSFPGQMPDIISAGGAYVSEKGLMQASDYSSAFVSRIYSGRSVPDVCGLVGLQPHANYLALPLPPGCELDISCSSYDGTKPGDGWGVFSGTSAAAPQLAGVCALLLEADPSLSPSDIKAILRRTARDVRSGRASPASDPDNLGILAGLGEDGATGGGLVDAFEAVKQVL